METGCFSLVCYAKESRKSPLLLFCFMEVGMENVYILGGLRSYIGVKDGMYRHIPAEKLGADILKEVVSRYDLPVDAIDFIIGGNAVGGGGNITRLAALLAGLPQHIPAVTLDLQCGSAVEAISAAAAKIESGLADLVIAGGMESSSVQPYRILSENHPEYDGGKIYTVAQFVPGKRGEQVMLEGAEETAIRENVSKEEMDAWVLKSHKRASQARKEGILEDITVSVEGSSKDEGIRPTMSQRLMDRLPYLLKDGTKITAANACLMHDGAAFVILCSEKFLKQYDRKSEFRFRFATAIGDDPMMSPKSAVSAAKAMLEKTGYSYQDIDAFEVNEAFAVIDVLFERAFPEIEERYNIWGGALAYGHPYGVSGAMILLHLMKALEQKKGHLGMCCVAAAGGIGSSIMIERIG